MLSSQEPDKTPERMAAIVMAGGKGTRMGAKSLPKVCFPALGVPAINRSIHSYRDAGIETIVVVVGANGQQVMETVANEHPGVFFAYQVDPRGTGDAVRTGFEPLRRIGFEGLVWCAVGDKIIDRRAVEGILAGLARADADGAFAVTDKPAQDMGVVFQHPDGRARAVVEQRDLRAAHVAAGLAERLARGETPSPADLRAQCAEAVGESRCEKFFGPLWAALQRDDADPARLQAALPDHPGMFKIGSEWFPAAEIEANAPYKNESLYCFRADTLGRGLEMMKPPPGREDYFTDVIATLLSPPKGDPADVRAVLIEDPTLMMGFNTPDQLLSIEDTLRRRAGRAKPGAVAAKTPELSRSVCRSAEEWGRLLDAPSRTLRKALRAAYGSGRGVIEERTEALRSLVRDFAKECGAERKTILARSPGSVNLMGRHVDVLGGYVNLMPVNREVLVAASARDDDIVTLRNGRSGKAVEFSVSEEISGLAWDDWLTYISSAKVREMVVSARTDWSSPVRAAVLRIQQQFRTRRLRGFDAVVHSDVPPAAGFDASGALMVAASEVYAALNGLALSPEEMMSLCGEGQRFLDHDSDPGRKATGKLMQQGHLTQMRFDPFEIERAVPWPEGLRLALCVSNSQSPATLTPEHRRRMFAAMEMGLMLVRDRRPQWARLLDRARDLNPARLGAPPSALYRALLDTPLRLTKRSARRLLSKAHHARLEELLERTEEAEDYPVREALLFGAAECARSQAFAEWIAHGDLAAAGEAMEVSHDAERALADGTSHAATDARLERLIDDLGSEVPGRVVRAQLARQSGRFGSSSPEIDRMVDAARSANGVVGAQLTGSGSAGCAIALTKGLDADALRQAVAGAAPQASVHSLAPVAPADLLRV